jgi:auxin efflux carrier (AEC)
MNSVETIIPIIAMILLGYVLKRTNVLKAEDAVSLNKIVINIAIPSLILLAIYKVNLSILPLIVPIPLICISVGIISGLIAYLILTLKNYPNKTKWSVVSTSALFNSGFLGYPVVLGVFGTDGFIRAIFYDMGSMILFISFGIFFLLMLGGKYSDILKRSLLFPPLWGILLGLLLNFLNIPLGYVITQTLTYLSGAAIPLIMISLGLTMEFRGIKEYIGLASLVSVIKLGIAPLIALTIVMLLNMGGLEKSVTVLEAGMPSAMLALVLAITYELDIKVSAACIFLSTVLSMVTLPLLLFLV